MSNELQRRSQQQVTVAPERPAQPIYVVYHAAHWLSGFERLHPSAQIALAIGAGLALPAAVLALGSLTTFALALLALMSEFILAIGAGVGIIVLVVVGVTAVARV